MFKRFKPNPLDVTEHPEVLAALTAMWDAAYAAGRADALAIARDWRDTAVLENGGRSDRAIAAYIEGVDAVIGELEA